MVSALVDSSVADKGSGWRSLFAAREVSVDALLGLARLGGLLYLVAGLGGVGLLMTNRGRVENVGGAIVMSSLNVVIGVVLIAIAIFPPVRFLQRHYSRSKVSTNPSPSQK
ncbi:MAG TPA: hypothetical protein VFR41_04595 [Acidimicrobiia bacterium]|nr:hypothetical protein [Acidimicrobiia bacterium]